MTFAIYARYSSDRQTETSIDDQVRRCREHIERVGGDAAGALVFNDYAISGASLQRPGFEAMMSAVESGKVTAIITEDMSRISRDFADAAAIFKRLQFAQIPLIGVANGMDTSRPGAKVGYMVEGIMSELYIDQIRDKTRRGLIGRAHAGMATGGVAFGYTTERTSAGSVIRIDDDAAAIVRRIFQLYADGYSYKRIAATLNAEGIPSPRAKTKHGSRGWIHATVRAMLRNERYVGRWTFNATEWVKRPGTNKRTPRKRGRAELIAHERPELRLIDERLWERVQKRLGSVGARFATGQRSTASRAVYPLSGLLYCGDCGAPMTIQGGKRTAKRYRCNDNCRRGTCANALSVREDLARRVILAGVRDVFIGDRELAYVRRGLAKALGSMSSALDTEIAERRKRIARTETKIRGLVDFIADGDRSTYVRETLIDLEAHLATDRRELQLLERDAARPIDLPSVDELTRSALDLERRIAADPVAGRERLHRLFRDRRINLRPVDGVYIAECAVLPLMALAPEPEKGNGQPATGSPIPWVCSGGRI